MYDNYNALAIGFAPSERTSEIVFSIAVYPRWVSLFFYYGVGLPDPERLLKGAGKQFRHVVLKPPEKLDEPAVMELMAAAMARALTPWDPKRSGRLVIKSVSAKQRPRRVGSAG